MILDQAPRAVENRINAEGWMIRAANKIWSTVVPSSFIPYSAGALVCPQCAASLHE